MINVYINGKKIRAGPQQAIGKGGEADVFQIDAKTALKLFKPPTHPDYQGYPQEQQAARDRLQLQQQKLPQFPKNLPSRVISPTALATERSGKTILGYTMPLLKQAEPLLRYSERSFRQQGISTQLVVQIFQDLHNTLSSLHRHQIIIGDFNDLNVLVRGAEAYLIDADSFQFGSFPCTVFTARFVDPLLCDPLANQPVLQQLPTMASDWYAFTVMLFQCLLFVDPYGGIYKPKNPTHKVLQAARSLHRISIFHPEVHYPKPAIPYSVLPDELLHYFQQVFDRDLRGEFPRQLLDNLRWTHCLHCGIEHARAVCPDCTQTTATIPRAMTTVRGKVTATQLFQTSGLIVSATIDQGQLRWVFHEQGEFRREDGRSLLKGDRTPYLSWWIQGETTFLGYQGQVLNLNSEQPSERMAVDTQATAVLFAVNELAYYWVQQGQLQQQRLNRVNTHPSILIGTVLPEQTRFWVGSRFGFGFYQAGNLNIAFVFDTNQPGMNDRVQLPILPGQLITANCTFSDHYGWLFLTTQTQGQIHHICMVIQADGAVVATAQACDDSDHWLTLTGRCGCAIGNFLLVPTDDGIVRIEIQQGQLLQTKSFPDTEPFVDKTCQLLPASQGLYVVESQVITKLVLS